jgi:hypothetical protein
VIGPKGNVEFLAWFGLGDEAIQMSAAITEALEEASSW